MKTIFAFIVTACIVIVGLIGYGIRAIFPEKPEPTSSVLTTITTTVPGTNVTLPPVSTEHFTTVPTTEATTEPSVPTLTKTIAIVDAEIRQLTERAGEAVTVNAAGTVTTYFVTGASLRDILEANGVDVDNLAAGAYLMVVSGDGFKTKLEFAHIQAADTILAWEYTSEAVDGVTGETTNDVGAAKDLPRLFPCSSDNSKLFAKQVVSLELFS